MGIFSRVKNRRASTKRHYHRPTADDLEKKQKRVQDKVAWESFVKAMKEDPELERQFILKKMGIEVKSLDPSEKKKQEIRGKLVDEALVMINEDNDMRREYAEGMIGEIIEVTKSRHRRSGGGEYAEPTSPALSLIDDVDSFLELKAKLAELGPEGQGQGGFFTGMTLKDLIGALPYVAALLGKGEIPAIKTYLIKVNGQLTEVPETQYQKLLQEGQALPAAEIKIIAPEKTEVAPVLTEETKEQETKLPEWLNSIDPDFVLTWFDEEPPEFVVNLKSEVDKGVAESRFLWGFLSTATYDIISNAISPYKDNEKFGKVVEKIQSDEGKAWLEAVLELIKGMNE